MEIDNEHEVRVRLRMRLRSRVRVRLKFHVALVANLGGEGGVTKTKARTTRDAT